MLLEKNDSWIYFPACPHSLHHLTILELFSKHLEAIFILLFQYSDTNFTTEVAVYGSRTMKEDYVVSDFPAKMICLLKSEFDILIFSYTWTPSSAPGMEMQPFQPASNFYFILSVCN